MELKEFQLNAVKSLFEAMDKPVRDIILKSPTGSGKTIILTYFMHQYIQSYPKTVFVWLTPGKGNLEEQSKAKMDIVYDTYDYLDKLIGFKLSDIFYAIFYQYYEATSDERALRLAKYFKYGTDKEREIWMLRYGFSFEEIEWVSECVDSIDETEIKFNDKINALDDAQLKSIEQYVHE